MPEIEINKIKMYYEIHGQGEPLLLIAGLASDSQSWLSVLKPLSKYFKVIIFDNRGVGRTLPQDCPISIELMTNDTALLIERLNLKQCHILGHSMGGFVAMDLAIKYPHLVDKLILVGSTPFNNPRNNNLFSDWVYLLESNIDLECWFKNIYYWIFTKDFFENTDLVRETLSYSINYPFPQSKEAFKAQVKAIKDFNCLGNLSMIKSKTLLLYGSEELFFKPEESIRLFSAINDLQWCIIQNSAHAIHLQKPKEFVDCTISFLQSK